MKKITIFALLLFSCTSFADDYQNHSLEKSEESKHFIYHFTEADTKYVKKLILLSEGFLSFIERNYFKPSFAYPITALVFSSKQEFHHHLKNKLNIQNPPNYGIYLKQYKLFATFRGSGIGTFTHEIMHPLVDVNLPDCPTWAIEGIPSFFEKFIGYWEGSELHLQLGYQNPWRIHRLGNKITELDLKSIIMQKQNRYKSFSNSELRIVSVFIDRQGLLKRYIQLIMQKNKEGYNSYIEATFGRTLNEIQLLWVSYLRNVELNRNSIYTIPSSRILKSKKEFDALKRKLYLQKEILTTAWSECGTAGIELGC